MYVCTKPSGYSLNSWDISVSTKVVDRLSYALQIEEEDLRDFLLLLSGWREKNERHLE